MTELILFLGGKIKFKQKCPLYAYYFSSFLCTIWALSGCFMWYCPETLRNSLTFYCIVSDISWRNFGSIAKAHYHPSHTAADQRVFNAFSGLAIILHSVFTAIDPLGPTVFINFWNMANFYTAGAFCSVRGSHGQCVPVVFIKRPGVKSTVRTLWSKR